jgi:ubiquinone/menaquinone biosynthesis C-methylase UbiE
MKSKENRESRHPHVCPHQKAFFLDNWVRKLFQSPKRIVGEYIKDGDTVIDLGCGPGFFTIEMAKLVGPQGKVIAVDLQVEMLEHVKKKLSRCDLGENIMLHRCQDKAIALNLPEKADFMLAYYMVHETPDLKSFLKEVRSLLKDRGKFLVVEPVMHVTGKLFEEMIAQAKEAGFQIAAMPRRKGGRSVLF